MTEPIKKEKNTERLSLNILGNVRENLGIEPDDDSKDERIDRMDNDELFKRWCDWHGLLGWDGSIKGTLRDIYGVEFRV